MKIIALITILSSLCNPIIFADEMPSEVKRRTVLKDRKVEEIEKKYWAELNKLKKKYAKAGNTKDALYIEKMQIAHIDSESEPSDMILFPKDADLKGKKIKIHPTRSGSTDGWHEDETIPFEIPNLSKGSYTVIVKYASGIEAGGRLVVKINNKSFRDKYNSTGSWETTADKNIGTFSHDGGIVKIEISVAESGMETYSSVNIFSLTLSKI